MKNRKPWSRIAFLFVILNLLFIVFQHRLTQKGFDPDVLIAGNLILFVATVLSFIIFQRSMKSVNPQASIRGLYGSFMIKFFICVIAAFTYIISSRQHVNKPSLFVCMGLYIVYTVIEVATLTRMLREKKNA